jgi:predicted SprT family Zn-dependent metalloprotease
MNLDEAQILAEELMGQHGLLERKWRFGWDRSTRQAGSCRFLATQKEPWRRIGLSRSITELNDRTFVRDTILHEIAHALAGVRHNHDATWREIALRIGCTGKRCHSGLRPRRALTERQWIARYMRSLRGK